MGLENSEIYRTLIKKTAKELGFSFCGISRARFLEEEASRFEAWLNRGHQGNMNYLERNFDKRMDPSLLVPGAKTVVSLLYNYYPKKNGGKKEGFKISKYAYGRDYHHVLKKKLKNMMEMLQAEIGMFHGRAFVDSAPVHERAWARKSGLGWMGKNSLLINRSMGSFFFLAELILDLEVKEDGPIKDFCGTCTACMDACPTQAIPEPYVVDGSRCIAYLTIELKEEIPSSFKGKWENWIFGCDICQDVCPWNRFSTPHREEQFDPSMALQEMDNTQWTELTEEIFKQVFQHSPLKRTGFSGLKRNIQFLSGSGIKNLPD